MRRIFKYTLSKPDRSGLSKIETRRNAKILSVGMQQDEIVVWATVDPKEQLAQRSFILHNTGAEMTTWEGDFLGTVTSSNGIVWHVFEFDL